MDQVVYSIRIRGSLKHEKISVVRMEKLLWSVLRMEKLLCSVVRMEYSKVKKLLCSVERMEKLLCSIGKGSKPNSTRI